VKLMRDFHLSDQELILALDGELATRDAARVQSHLGACWTCRTRMQEFESAIAGFVHARERSLGARLPPPHGPRALLKAHLAQMAAARAAAGPRWFLLSLRLAAAIAGMLLVGLGIGYFWVDGRVSDVAVAVPDPELTPGATVSLSRGEVCRESNTKNKPVPVSLQRQVFKAYGIPYAKPRSYEVDYLITPALGGADDIHNLWPQSYAHTAWNAEVKDELEDHLRELVCEGKVDLATAQREIAANWIEAYKKYFHTDHPLNAARR
jgi:hypothetical protein